MRKAVSACWRVGCSKGAGSCMVSAYVHVCPIDSNHRVCVGMEPFSSDQAAKQKQAHFASPPLALAFLKCLVAGLSAEIAAEWLLWQGLDLPCKCPPGW